MIKIKIPENLAEKPPPSFLPFYERPGSCHTCRIPMSPYYKSTLRFLLFKYLLSLTNFINFSKYSHIQKYRTQDHGAGGSPIGSLTTIHTNIPAITVTVLAIALEMSLGYCMFMLIYHYPVT